MITKQDIKDYDFATLDQYFDYVLDSEINGNRNQVRVLISDMSVKQKKDCASYLQEHRADNEDRNIVINLIFEAI